MWDMGPKVDMGRYSYTFLFWFIEKSYTSLFWFIERRYTFFSKRCYTLFFFPFLEKEALHLVVEEDNYWASIESIDMHE